MRVQQIDAMQWTSGALEYWQDCIEALDGVTNPDEELIPGLNYGVPMMDWECRYCGFTEHCKGI
jgi:predicted RecB family nuclease